MICISFQSWWNGWYLDHSDDKSDLAAVKPFQLGGGASSVGVKSFQGQETTSVCVRGRARVDLRAVQTCHLNIPVIVPKRLISGLPAAIRVQQYGVTFKFPSMTGY